MPFTTLQRADSLQPGESEVTAAVGAGMAGVGWPEGGYGGVLQGRTHVGATDIELSGHAISYSCSGCGADYQGQHISIAGRVGVKRSFGDAAIETGVGFAGGAAGKAIGADSALIVNAGSYCYLSGRVGLAGPIGAASGEIGEAPATFYEAATFGFRTHGRVALIGEAALADIQAGDKDGMSMFFSVGVDLK